MKKSLLKRAWDGLLYGAGRDVLAVAIAGALMLSESPVGFARYAWAEGSDETNTELVEGSGTTGGTGESGEGEDSAGGDQGGDQGGQGGQGSEGQGGGQEGGGTNPTSNPETTGTTEGTPETAEDVEAEIFHYSRLFGEIKFVKLYLVDKDGNVAQDNSPMPTDGFQVSDEYDWRFILKPKNDAYEIDSVAYRVGSETPTKIAAQDDVYAIPKEAITKAAAENESLTLEIETHATAARVEVDLSAYTIYLVGSDGTRAATPMADSTTRSFNIPLDKDFVFGPVAYAGSEVEAVKVQVGTGDAIELEADDNDNYTITQSVIDASATSGDPIQLIVSTTKAEAEEEQEESSNLPVPITQVQSLGLVGGLEQQLAPLAATDAISGNAREFSHELSDYLDKNYDTSAYGVSGITINGAPIQENMTVNYGDKIELKLAWGFPNTMAVKAGDQFFYQLPESVSWAFEEGTAAGDVTNENGERVGGYVIDGSGLATITYTQDLGSNVVGSFTVRGNITLINEGGDDSIISFSLAGKDWNVIYTSGESSVEINKTGGDYASGAEDLSLREFTIEVLSIGENENIEITDTPNTFKINNQMSTALEYVEGSLHAYSDEACTQEIDQSRVSVSEVGDDGSFVITIASMKNFEKIYLRYESRITLDAYNAALGRSWNYAIGEVMGGYDAISTKISNTASLSTEETSTVEIPSFLPSYIRQKTGKYDADKSLITWTVTAYTGDTPLTLQEYLNNANGDNHYNQLLGIENIHLYESSDGGKTYAEVDLSVARNLTAEGLLDGTATLPGSTTGGVRRYFQVVFDTPIDPYPTGATNYQNWIAGNGRVFSSGKGVYGEVTVGSGATVSIEKTSNPTTSYINYDTEGNIIGTPEGIHWISHVSVPVLDESSDPYTNFVITDTEQNWQNQRLVEGSVHVYSDAERTKEVTSQFTLDYIHQTWNGEDFIQGFTLKSDNFKGGELYITVDATIVKVTNSANFTNKIKVEASEFRYKEATSTHYVSAHRLSKRWEPDLAGPDGWRGSGWTHTNSNTGRVTWSVVVSGLGNGELDLNPALVVKDSAPDRLVVDPDSFSYVIGAVDGWHTVVNQGGYVNDIETTIEGGTITFDIKPGGDAYEALRAGKSIVLVYDTTYNPDYSSDGFSVTPAGDKVTNTVGLSVDGQSVDTVSSSFTFKHQELLVKEAEYNESTAPNAIFTIECNFWGGDLDPNSDYLTLTDTAGSALSINTNSITVTTYDSTGKVIDDHVALADMAEKGFSYTRNTTTGAVTFTVPDSLHFSLSYESLVTLAPGASITDESASNTVTLAGYTTPSRTSIGSQVYSSRATTTSVGYGVSVEKVDADFTNVHVGGATYAVERVDVNVSGGTWKATGSVEVGRITTADTGFSPALTGLVADQVYRLVEVESPDDYLLSSDVFYLVFQGSQGEETIDYSQVTLVDENGNEVPFKVYSSDSATQRILRSDHQLPGTLTITKHTSANTTTPGDTAFKVDGPNNYHETVYYRQFKDGSYTLTDLVPGQYTVTEDTDSAQKTSYTLEVTVGEDGDLGSNQIVKVEPGAAAEVSFTNTYTRFETKVDVTKVWDGPTPADTTVTVHLLADGERLSPDVALELTADGNWRGSFNSLPIYDEDDGHVIEYTVEETEVDGYVSTITGDATTGFTIKNTFTAEVTVEATKYAYGRQDVYSFTLTGATAAGVARSTAAGIIEAESGAVDHGTEAIVYTATTGSYLGTRARVSFPITYNEPGDYYYLMSEDATTGEPHDDTVYLVHVAVANDASVEIDYTPQGAGEISDSAEFYNNGGLMLFGMAASLARETSAAQVASFQPVAHKELDGRALAADEFSFALLDADGNTISEATNDVDGVVAFDRISYTQPGTYTYTMVEENTGQPGVDYDLTEHTVEVTVAADEDGVLSVASATYDGEEAEPTFSNAVQVVIVRIRKVSRDGTGDPLFNSVYGLWIEGTDGNADIYLGNDASDEDGYIYIENVPVVEGATYYFKEESAPEGHLVDPYRIAHFSIARADDGTYYLISREG